MLIVRPRSARSAKNASFLKASKVIVGIRGIAGVAGAEDAKSMGIFGVGGVSLPSRDGGCDLEDFRDNEVVRNFVMLFFFFNELAIGELPSCGAVNASLILSISMIKSALNNLDLRQC